MYPCNSRKSPGKRLTSLILSLILALCCLPLAAFGQEEQQVVRVGWFDSSFCYWDSFGRRRGIDYEYQHKIAAYTGWRVEYVEDSWPNLFQMLENGEIDLLSDVSYKPERTEFISYPDLPMGAESYYIYIDAKNQTLSGDDPSSFNGARIGVNQGSVQEGFLRDWARKYGVFLTVVHMTLDEDECMEMVTEGKLDGFASIYSMGSEQKVLPVCRIGASEYYCAVNKRRPDILAQMNVALAGIQDEDPDFVRRLSEARIFNTQTDAFLTPTQEDWLEGHGPIKVGYRDNYLPFCQTDWDTGELTGALKDYLAHAVNNLRTADIQFETIPYPTTEKALEAMRSGEVDCVFPVYLSSYDADQQGIRLTNPAMKTETNAVMRADANHTLSRTTALTFAVLEGDVNIQTFIMDLYPASTIRWYPNMDRCYQAVGEGEADCVMVSNYRIPSAESSIKKYRLFSLPSGESISLSFAVKQSDRDLYFLLNRAAVITRSEDMDSALASYMISQHKVSFEEFLKDNWLGVVALLMVVFGVIVVLLLEKLKAERTANDQRRLKEEGLRRELEQKVQLQSAMDMAFRDPLTGVKSKHAYNEAQKNMDQRIEAGQVKEFSVVLFDLNNLKRINDTQGHDAGDEYIKAACKLICTCFKHSPVYRIGGDEFTAILEGEDFANQEELLEHFEKQVLENVEKGRAVVAFGASRFQPQRDKSIRAVFERADSRMYHEKHLLKSLGAAATGEVQPVPEQQVRDKEPLTVVSLRKHLLIVDDSESSRELLGELLREDYDILYAGDGVEALDTLQTHKDEIALVMLDMYMPKMTGRELINRIQVDEELMSIPVIFISVDQNAELDCLKLGAMDFIPKPYPDIEIVKARIAKCIELSENRDLIRRTQRDRLTGLFNIDYFLRYVNRYDQRDKGAAFDALVCYVDQFHLVNQQYGHRFGDLALRSIGIGIGKLARKTGGMGCRTEGDTFLLYCPHREDYDQLLRRFLDELFVEKETASKLTLRLGLFANAQQEPDPEERFVRAKTAAETSDPQGLYGSYEYQG